MSILSAVFLGFLQGLTEFLPVSSSGHLALVQTLWPALFSGSDTFTFDVLLHLATLAAVVIAFRKTLIPLFPAALRVTGKLLCRRFRFSGADGEERMVCLLFLGTLPLAGALLLGDRAEAWAACPKAVGSLLILNGVLLFLADRIPSGRNGAEMRPRHALIVGCCQLGAIFPGLSRSGSTVTGGLLCGLSREQAVNFSFLLSIPAILGAALTRIPSVVAGPVPAGELLPCVCGMLTAGLTGALAIRLLRWLSKRADFRIFSLYCVLIGSAILLWA